MKEKKEADIHIIGYGNSAPKVMRESAEEIREDNELLDAFERKVRQRRLRLVKRCIVAMIALVLVLTGAYVIVSRQTYHSVHIMDTHKNKTDNGERYVRFADGILKYSRDGVVYIDKNGREQWNSPYQIKNPIVSVKGEAAAVADKSGNDISVFQEKGLKGEIHTNLPIEKIAVSAQGIVSVVLKDGTASKIICYDAAGSILVEHETSAASGYPLDLAISDDGYMLLVSYLLVEDGGITSKVAYYNFGEKQKKDNYLVTEEKYEESVIPSVFFLDNSTSAVVSDNALMIYKGKQKPKKTGTIELKNGIKSVFYNDTYIGIVSQGEKGNMLSLYDNNGEKVMSEKFEGEYKNIKIEGNQVIMYDGKKCNIYAKSGVHKFVGEFETDIMEILPLFGVNKYLVINANGLEEIRLAK